MWIVLFTHRLSDPVFIWWDSLEKSFKYVDVGDGEEDDGQEGAEAAVQDCRRDRNKSLCHAVGTVRLSTLVHVGVNNVGREVDAQPDADDQDGTGDSVDLQILNETESLDDNNSYALYGNYHI